MQRGPLILDGARLAEERARVLAERAERVRRRRGRTPTLALIAFEDDQGRSPYAARKIREAERVGVDVIPLIMPGGLTTESVARQVQNFLEEEEWDGVFLEFPFPPGVDPDTIEALIPERLDLDIMTTERMERYLAGVDQDPPLTITAAIELLDAYRIDVRGARTIVIADQSSFAESFIEALTRRGAAVAPLIGPDDQEIEQKVGNAELVISTAMRPGVIESDWLADGTIAIDAGYFNPGGKGDIDTTPGISHLAAIAPVPGSIGPMTISVLLERLIDNAT